MADLNLRRDRGQILLIAAFALAVVFLAFAILTNSAIFTENLASRGETTGSDEALVMRAAAEENVGQSIETANYYNYSSDPLDAFNESLQNVSTQTEFMSATSGVLINVSYVDHRMGSRFNGSSSPPDIDNIPEEDGTRALKINTTSLPTSSNKFTIIANESSGSNRWKTEIYNDTANNEIVVETNRSVVGGSNFETEECRVQATPPYRIDVTGGEINGTTCSALYRNSTTGTNFTFSTGVGTDYNIEFENTPADANYSVVVRDTTTMGEKTAIYDVTTRFTYDGTDITYNTTIRVAPGEPDA